MKVAPLTDEMRRRFGFDPKVKGVIVVTFDASSSAASKNIRGPAPEKVKQTQALVQGIAERMGFEAEFEIRDEEERIVVAIKEKEGSTSVSDMFSETRPPALPAFQFILNKIVNRFPDNRKHIVVEAESVRKAERQRELLEQFVETEDESVHKHGAMPHRKSFLEKLKVSRRHVVRRQYFKLVLFADHDAIGLRQLPAHILRLHAGHPPFEAGVSQNAMDYLHVINWRRAARSICPSWRRNWATSIRRISSRTSRP